MILYIVHIIIESQGAIDNHLNRVSVEVVGEKT